MIYQIINEDAHIIIDKIVDMESENTIVIDEVEINNFIAANISDKTIIIDSEGNILFKDEKYYNIPVKDIKRVSIIKEAKLKVESLVQKVDMITYINYIDINNELSSHGIFITNNNREEKYLEILEIGDENLIDLLEAFLEAKDELQVVKSAKKDFNRVLQSVYKLTEDDVEELDKISSSI